MLRFLLRFSSCKSAQTRKNPTNRSNFDADL
nr:MAG TPA: hypothetical protein [Caudoviricetes sp.]